MEHDPEIWDDQRLLTEVCCTLRLNFWMNYSRRPLNTCFYECLHTENEIQYDEKINSDLILFAGEILHAKVIRVSAPHRRHSRVDLLHREWHCEHCFLSCCQKLRLSAVTHEYDDDECLRFLSKCNRKLCLSWDHVDNYSLLHDSMTPTFTQDFTDRTQNISTSPPTLCVSISHKDFRISFVLYLVCKSLYLQVRWCKSNIITYSAFYSQQSETNGNFHKFYKLQ